MILIQFNGSDEKHPVDFKRSSDIVTLKGITEAQETGFTTFTLDGKTQLGKFPEFTTIYRIGANYVKLSNNGRVYRMPEPLNVEG